MRTPSKTTPDMHDYVSRRPNCIIESLQKTYQSSFVVYSGPQSHYIEKKVHKKEPEWLYECCKARTVHTVEEDDQTMEEAKELRLFAKEFGQGVRQQRVRGKTQEKAGTLLYGIIKFPWDQGSNFATLWDQGSKFGAKNCAKR